MTTIDLAELTQITGGAAKPLGDDLAKSVDVFADQLRRSSRKQVHNLAVCDYRTSQDRASGDPARIARAEHTNCNDLLAPSRKR
ncbi:MAG: hypothetical protein QM831_43230 [Kofleriaceae bacterium]